MTTLALAVGRTGGTGARARWPEEALAERTAQVLAPVLRHDESAVVSEDVLLVRLGKRLPARRRTAQLLSHLHDHLPGRDVVVGAGLSPGRRGVRRAGRLARASLRGGDQTVLPDLAARRRPVGAHRRATVLQVLAASVLTFLVPLAALGGLDALGLDAAGAVLGVTAAAVLVMAVLVWAEALASLPRLPARRDVPPAPPATALVVAYLPNEVATVVGAVRSALAQDYPGELQVVLAYNSPVVLPVERELAEIARADDRLTLLRVEGSTSKAENVNAALALVRGEFVGLFDADHRPTPSAFRRAWRRLSDGADVVQGRCAVRNGGQSAIARLVACEFEQIYGVSHPGRQRVHGFGVFGGSNGYWRTAVLRRVRLRTSYLTEDIESSIRAVRDGVRIVNDPTIVSLELAPTTLPALWAQRLRWSQGWFQVTARHLHGVATSPRLGLRQRLGMVLLLGWREAYPWTSALVLPALVHLALQGRLDDVGVVGLLALVFSWSTTPLLALLTWSRSLPHVRRRWSWWVGYLLLSPLYAELRNLIMRVAVLKELRGERRWVVTPRGAAAVRPRVLRVRRPAPAPVPTTMVPGESAPVVSVV